MNLDLGLYQILQWVKVPSLVTHRHVLFILPRLIPAYRNKVKVYCLYSGSGIKSLSSYTLIIIIIKARLQPRLESYKLVCWLAFSPPNAVGERSSLPQGLKKSFQQKTGSYCPSLRGWTGGRVLWLAVAWNAEWSMIRDLKPLNFELFLYFVLLSFLFHIQCVVTIKEWNYNESEIRIFYFFLF